MLHLEGFSYSPAKTHTHTHTHTHTSPSDGVGRTGAFICIHAQLERLKTEGVVDFFQYIKSARVHRAWLVPEVVSSDIAYRMQGLFMCMRSMTHL